jgi:hypothetical protein
MDVELSIEIKEEGMDGMEELCDLSSKGLPTEDESVSVSNDGKIEIVRSDDPAASTVFSGTPSASTSSMVWMGSAADISSSMTGDKGDIFPTREGLRVRHMVPER